MKGRSLLLLAASALATVCMAIPLTTGVWLLLYYFVLPRDRGDAGPADPPDINGWLSLIGGSISLAWGVLLLAFTIGAWWRRRWGYAGMAVLCTAQCMVHMAFLTRGIRFQPAWILPAYTALLMGFMTLGPIAAIYALRNDRFLVLPPSITAPSPSLPSEERRGG